MIFKNCKSTNYGGRRSTTKYIVIHFTSNNGDTVQNNLDYFARETVKASAHYFVDENCIGASVPESHIAYHVGSKQYKHKYCRNSNSIGIEMCSRLATDKLHYYFKPNTVKQAAKLTADLMKKYNIPIHNVLRHYDVTGKNCPEPMVYSPAAWTDFKNRVLKEYHKTYEVPEDKGVEEVRYKTLNDVPEGEFRDVIKHMMDKGYIHGTGDGIIDLSEDMVRMFVINYRAGFYK